MNAELLRNVQKKITGSPQRFDMCSWVEKGECGTVCCIAGWTCVLSGIPEDTLYDMECESPTSLTPELACGFLGITRELGDEIFHFKGWPKEYRGEYFEADTHHECAGIACRRIDAFIAKHEPASIVTEPELAFA